MTKMSLSLRLRRLLCRLGFHAWLDTDSRITGAGNTVSHSTCHHCGKIDWRLM